MKIFVTGATGYIGNAVAKNLAAAGHRVYGTARSEEKGKALAAAEIQPVIGNMEDAPGYSSFARQCDVLIHCAAEYSERFLSLDRMVVEALIAAARQSNRPALLLYTSGVWLYGDTGDEMVDEGTPLPADTRRLENEKVVLGANHGSVRTIVLRPGCVYGGSGSLTAAWFESATRDGEARIVGDGNFRWAMVHVQDLADLYRRAAESHWAGQIFNGTDRSRFTVLECAKAASRAAGAGGKVVSVPLEEAIKTNSSAPFLVLNQHVDSSKAVRMLGWQPRHGGFVDGVERYYLSWKATQ